MPNVYQYCAGTRLSSAYTAGRDGLPCPRYCAEKSSAAYKAWRAGINDRQAANAEFVEQNDPRDTAIDAEGNFVDA